MRYTTEITINLPRERVVELFDSFENMKHWQPSLRSYEHISGEPGQPGAQSRLVFDRNGRDMVMVETITARSLPHSFSGRYEANGVWNELKNTFEEVGPNQTHWVMENEFRLSGFMRIIGWLMPGTFRKASQASMERFKAFAEGERTT